MNIILELPIYEDQKTPFSENDRKQIGNISWKKILNTMPSSAIFLTVLTDRGF